MKEIVNYCFDNSTIGANQTHQRHVSVYISFFVMHNLDLSGKRLIGALVHIDWCYGGGNMRKTDDKNIQKNEIYQKVVIIPSFL